MKLKSTWWIWSSIIISILVFFSSVLGIFYPKTYSLESANWTMQAYGQDIGNLLAIIMLLGSTYLLQKGSSRAFFLWLGTLFYVVYAFLIYAFFMHFNYLFLVYVAVLGLSTYTIIGRLLDVNVSQHIKFLKGKKFPSASILLITIGSVFGCLWLSEIIPALSAGQAPKSVITAGLWTNPIHVIDLAFVLPALIITGLLLWKKHYLGYTFAAPWLTFSVLMGSSIIATLILYLNNGNKEAIAPLFMVSLIVLASVVILTKFLNVIKY